jgi:carboxylesterase type B
VCHASPTAVQNADAIRLELDHLQTSLHHQPRYEYSDTHCLNLNVFVPSNIEGLLPVVVFVHGGGFRIGSSAWPQNDLSRLVKLSADAGLPVIGVSIKSVGIRCSMTVQ